MQASRRGQEPCYHPRDVSEDELKNVLRRVIAPLIEADDGELYLVPASTKVVHLHLRGRFSGCPGNGLVTQHVLRPVITASRPSAQIQVTSGALLPEGAERILPRSPKESEPAFEKEAKNIG